MTPNMLGAYGEWASQAVPDPPRLSFRQPMFTNVDTWRPVARARYRETLLGPGGAATPAPVVQHKLEFDGLSIEHLQWQLPYGPPAEALLLKPIGATGKLPGIVGLHDHARTGYTGVALGSSPESGTRSNVASATRLDPTIGTFPPGSIENQAEYFAAHPELEVTVLTSEAQRVRRAPPRKTETSSRRTPFYACFSESAKGAARTAKEARNRLAPHSVLRVFLRKRKGCGAHRHGSKKQLRAALRFARVPQKS